MKDEFISRVGLWGQRHYNFLKKNNPTVINVMRLNGILEQYLTDFNRNAQEMFELLKKMDTASGGPCNITSVTVFGICDDYPLYDNLVQCLYLWDKNAKPKESFYRVREVGESK